MTQLRELLSNDSPDIQAISSHLDALDPETRLAEVRSLGKAHQRRLFDAASGFLPLDLDYFVPADQAPMTEVVHYGKNSLGIFTHFAKVFVRPDGDDASKGELWGYNRNSWFLETFVGPGYFVALPYTRDGEVVIDYRRVPPRKPEAWPKILTNSQRLSVVVYNGMEDVMRGVSKHVSIGRATKAGKELNNWFVLCREA
ncbi:MAG: hypothetical protein KC543_01480 [Myxococcales bacterium]|nr:hypothetical protein [Myxococcales bacterium]